MAQSPAGGSDARLTPLAFWMLALLATRAPFAQLKNTPMATVHRALAQNVLDTVWSTHAHTLFDTSGTQHTQTLDTRKMYCHKIGHCINKAPNTAAASLFGFRHWIGVFCLALARRRAHSGQARERFAPAANWTASQRSAWRTHRAVSGV